VQVSSSDWCSERGRDTAENQGTEDDGCEGEHVDFVGERRYGQENENIGQDQLDDDDSARGRMDGL